MMVRVKIVELNTSAFIIGDLQQGGEHSAPFAFTALTRDSRDAIGSSATTGGLLPRYR
jgi:hypothetical protein